MQTGTVSRLWFRGRPWRFEIHFWRNIVHFRKSYICSNKLDVQETNFSFTQFNRIWNYLLGHRTEIGWFACSGIMGSDCFCLWKRLSNLRSIRASFDVRNIINFKGESMWWKTLIQFPQTSNPRVKKLYCMCLRTMKQWSKWSLKEGVPTMRHVSRTHRVALDWLFDRINLDPKIQIKNIDTKNQLADILTKGNFTRDEWNHFVVLV